MQRISAVEMTDLATTVSMLAKMAAARHPDTAQRIEGVPPEIVEHLAALDENDRLRLARIVREDAGKREHTHHWWRWVLSILNHTFHTASAVPASRGESAGEALHTLATVAIHIELIAVSLTARHAEDLSSPTIPAAITRQLSQLSRIETLALAHQLAERHVGLPEGKPEAWWKDQIRCARNRFELDEATISERRPLADMLRLVCMK